MSDTEPPAQAEQPGPGPAAGSAPAVRRGLSTRTKLVAAAAALVVLAGGGVAAWTVLGSGPQYQKVSSAGSDPFMDPIGQDQPNITPVADAGPAQGGDTRGMFAQDPAHPACDSAALVSNLQGDPARASAWAGVLGITPGLIPQFVNSLTPVVLRSDTGVTDHGYTGGSFTSTPATLAAGTAVLANSYGEPTVKCFTGDPLTRGATTGDKSVIVVYPAPQQITRNVFVNVTTGRPVIVAGKPDPKPNPGPNPTTGTPAPQPDPTLEKAATDAKATADDAGKTATDARAAANDKKVAATIFATEARNRADAAQVAAREEASFGSSFNAAAQALDADTKKLNARPNDPGLKSNVEQDKKAVDFFRPKFIEAAAANRAAQQKAADAKTAADEKANQAKFADAAATSAEGVKKAADDAAKKAQADADKAAGRIPANAPDPAKPATLGGPAALVGDPANPANPATLGDPANPANPLTAGGPARVCDVAKGCDPTKPDPGRTKSAGSGSASGGSGGSSSSSGGSASSGSAGSGGSGSSSGGSSGSGSGSGGSGGNSSPSGGSGGSGSGSGGSGGGN